MQKYQEDRIKIIKEILPLLGDNYILKGGTALKLYYGLSRYSEDIDLDSLTGYMNIVSKLKRHRDFKKWNITISKDTDTVFRIKLDYGANTEKGAYPLKIEVSSRNSGLLRDNLLKYNKINNINVYDVDELISMKIRALTGRDKIRDFFDVNFLMDKYPDKFSLEQILAIKEKVYYFGEIEIDLLFEEENFGSFLVKTENNFSLSEEITKNVNKLINKITSKEKKLRNIEEADSKSILKNKKLKDFE